MCHLNILIKTNKVSKNNISNITGFLMGVTSNSYISNSDGDGIYCDNLLLKSGEKLNLNSINEVLEKSNIILSHQRLATSGLTTKYTQPFMNEEFVLIHNGVINDFLGNKGSDTYGFFNKFTRNFKKSKEKDRNKAIVKTIKKSLKKLEMGGSYSIALLDKKTNNLYYFKNYRTSIYFYKSKNMLYITTSLYNDKILNLFDEEFKERNIKDEVIYKIKITKKDKISIQIEGIIKTDENNYNNENNVSLFNWDKINEEENKIKENEEEENNGLMRINGFKSCIMCGKLTNHILTTTGESLCLNCASEYNFYNNVKYHRYIM